MDEIYSTSHLNIRKKERTQIERRSALLYALLPPTGVNFYANLVKFCVVKLNEVSKLEPIQKHCF